MCLLSDWQSRGCCGHGKRVCFQLTNGDEVPTMGFTNFKSYVLSGCLKRSATLPRFMAKVPPGVVKRIPHAMAASAAIVPFTA